MKRRVRETEKYGEAGARARETVRTARRPGVSRVFHRFTDRELEGETGRLVDPSTGNLSREIGARGSGAGGYTRSPNVRSRHYAKRNVEPKVDHSDMQDSYDPAIEFGDRVMNRVFEMYQLTPAQERDAQRRLKPTRATVRKALEGRPASDEVVARNVRDYRAKLKKPRTALKDADRGHPKRHRSGY